MFKKIKNAISCHLFNSHEDYETFFQTVKGEKLYIKKTCKHCWREKVEEYK